MGWPKGKPRKTRKTEAAPVKADEPAAEEPVDLQAILKGRMKPVVIVERMAMSTGDLNRLRENGVCVVECRSLDLIRFVDSSLTRDCMEQAAIEMFKFVLREGDGLWRRDQLISRWCALVAKATNFEPAMKVSD